MLGLLAIAIGALALVFGVQGILERAPRSGPSRPRLSERVRDAVLAWRDLVEVQIHGRPNVSVPLVLAVIARESAGDPNATGSVGEIGLMQVGAAAFTDYLREIDDGQANEVQDLEAPDVNIRVGAWFLNRKIEEMGSVFHGLRAYNAGTVGATNNPLRSAEYARWVLEVAKPEFRNTA